MLVATACAIVLCLANRFVYEFAPLDSTRDAQTGESVYKEHDRATRAYYDERLALLGRTLSKDPLPWQYYCGGLFVALHCLSSMIVGNVIGIGRYFLLLIVAILVFTAPCDHYGFMGQKKRPMTATKGAGLLITLAGIGLYGKFVSQRGNYIK